MCLGFLCFKSDKEILDERGMGPSKKGMGGGGEGRGEGEGTLDLPNASVARKLNPRGL